MRILSRVVLIALPALFLSGYVTSTQNLTAPDATIPASYLGMHMHGMIVPRSYTGKSTLWPEVPFATWRLWGAYVDWPNLEPQKGEWHFEVLDKYVDFAQQHNVDILLTLGLVPRWGSTRPNEKSSYGPGLAAEPKNLDDWRNYVRTVATRYKGRIHEYEIWNEPNLKSFYTGNPDQMVVLTREARTILKEVDPSIRVVSPSPTKFDGVDWLRRFLSSGGGKYIDVIGFHFYTMDLNQHDPEAMLPMISQVRQLAVQNGLSALPIWDTETGWNIVGCTPASVKLSDAHPSNSLSQTDAAAYVARAYILAWAAGVSRLYWYAWDNLRMGLLDCDGTTLKPSANAYAQIGKWLVGARMKSCASASDGTWTCSLVRNNRRQYIVWNESQAKSFQVPSAWGAKDITDLTGQQRDAKGSVEIGPTPQLIQ